MNFLVQRSDVGEFRRRYSWLVLGVIGTFLILLGRLAQIQLIDGDVHHAQARKNIVSEVPLATTRGVIRDAFGKVLAANRPSYNVYVHPSVIDLDNTWPRLIQLMALDPAEAQKLKARVLELRNSSKKDQQTLLKVDIDRDVVAALETHKAELRG